jgi:hypothetical protein
MKLSLLELTQNILSSLESDEVNSISDTVESTEVSYIIRDTYFELIEARLIPELWQLTKLTGIGNTAAPNYLQIPDNVGEIGWFRYNTIASGDTDIRYTEVKYITPEDFINRSNQRLSSDTTIQTVLDLYNSTQTLILNDTPPTFYTSFDDKYVVCDSFDSAVDTTLQTSKTQIHARINPTWTHTDSAIPLIDDNYFPLLLAEAKSMCFLTLKQMANPGIEAVARRLRSRLQMHKHKISSINNRVEGPDYGRK